MAHPRRVVPGGTYLVTRRCYQRTFRLRPSAPTNEIFGYCLAFAMHKTGVKLHAACVMSNHHHLVVSDPRGVLPDFLRELHRLTAKAMNASQGQWENLWAAEPCNVVQLTTPADVEDKIAYVVANPVAAGLVRQPHEWPGFLAWGEQHSWIRRPTAYFRDRGTCPERIQLAIDWPPAPSNGGHENRWHERLACAISTRVAAAHRAISAAGRVFLGPKAVLLASFSRRAQSYEEKRRIIPTFAAQVRSVRERLRSLEQDFRRSYRSALKEWRSGRHSTRFPFGTWGMRLFHAANVEPPASA